jgi:hypothetical protein
MRAHDAEEVRRADSLLDDVRNAEGRAERLYKAAEAILARALDVKDLRTALQAIRAAADVMGRGANILNCAVISRASLLHLGLKGLRHGYRF